MAEYENLYFGSENSKGVGFGGKYDQGVGNCEQMVGTFGRKAELSAEVIGMECMNVGVMEWNDECRETEQKISKIKIKKKRVLPSWILEGKEQNPPDTENIDSSKTGKKK